MFLKRSWAVILFICSALVVQAQDTTTASRMRSIIYVAPFQFTENGLGFGAGYEHILGHKGVFSFTLPVLVTFSVANTNRIYDYNTGNYSTGRTNAMYYTMPGIKIYPTGCYGKLRYAVGVALVAGSGKESTGYINLYGLNTTERTVPHFLMGGVVQNSLNVNAGKRLYAGVEAGVGTTFINHVDGQEQGGLFLIDGCIKIGYRL